MPPTRLAPIALLGMLSAAIPGPAPAEPPEPARPAVVPFEMLASNHMVLRATINGKGPYHLIFDVGAPITLLSNRAAEESGVIKPDAPRALLFSVRGEADVEKFEVGDLAVKDLPVIVLDHPILKALGELLERRLDGIVGYTFFARFKTTIDYQTKRMTFEPVKAEVRDLFKELPQRLAGPKVARERVLAPVGLWGLAVGAPEGGLATPGVPVSAVLADSPAAAAGLQPGDILTTLDGRWTTSIDDIYAAAAGVEPGRAVPVVVLRDGRELTLAITPVAGF